METALNKVLKIIIYFLATIILIVTISAFALRSEKKQRSQKETNIEKYSNEQNKTLSSFTGLGRLRCATKDGISIVISPWFSYKKDDTAFFEELAAKTEILKSIISIYFAEHTKKELLEKTEDKLKSEIIELLNEKLVLNKIAGLYFAEYIILE